MRASVIFLLGLLATGAGAAPLHRFDTQLATFSTDTALVFPSEAIDEHPLWSTDGLSLAVNVEGEWRKIDLEAIVFQEGNWRGGQPLAVISNKSAVTAASAAEVAEWKTKNTLNPRKASVGGTLVELRQDELSTALIITRPGRKPETRWESDMENCHSLVVSPDHAHVAFLCEMNGAFILRVAEEPSNSRLHRTQAAAPAG